MEETKKYEPLRLKPCLRSYLWGGTRLRGEYHKTGEGVIAESWELSVRADGQTYIDSGEHCGESLADVLRADPVGMAGTRCGIAPFPLLIKLIDAQKDLSVQVHPSDASACREKGEQGKTEMWYVVDCRPESTLFLGFSRAVTPDELRRRAKDGTICEVLNRVAVHPGDVFFVRPGTVHAIGAGILVAEIQQNSDTTFRVYDYNRLGADGKPRQLHLERAAEVMNYAPMHRAADTLPPCPPDGVQEVLTCEYFRVRRAEVKTRISLATDGESFTHLMCVRGEGNILCGGKVYPFRQGDSYFLPAALGEYAVEGDGKVMSCGNGGSLCDAMHFAEEMTGRYRSNRRPYAALAISDASHMACVGNDYGYEEVFSRYVEAHGRKGDVLLAITTSGTSRNIVKAAEVARRKGVKVVALTGRDETPITELADVSIVTPAGRWADRVQELHIKCIHILIELIERRLDKQNYE